MVSTTPKNIFCTGSIIMDISVRCPQFPSVGETMYTSFPYELAPGGKGGNQAVAAARLGGNVKILGRLSTDDYGKELEKNLLDSNVDIQYLTKDEKEKSGVAFVWVNESGENQIICSPAVNTKCSFDDYAKVLHNISPGDIVIITLELPGILLEQIIKLVKEKEGFLILDPSGGDYSRLSPDLMSYIDLVKPNEVEAEILTGIKITDISSQEKALEILEKYGVSYPLISLGENGIIYKNNGKIIHLAGQRVNALDTTAAGDTFIGAFAAKLSHGFSIDESVQYGNIAASICVQRKGAQSSIPSAKEVDY